MPRFEIEELADFDIRNAVVTDAQQWLWRTIERLCEQAKAKGPNMQLIVGSLGQNPRTRAWELPYAFVEAPAHVRPGMQVFGPWP